MVTHEPGIAAYCKRNVVFRDGQVIGDHPVEDRRIAADELAAMLPPEQDAPDLEELAA